MTSATQRSRGAVVARGLLSLVGILLILVGLPLALAILGGNPLPEQMPTWDEVVRAVTRPDDGTLLIGVITVVGWLVWLSLALSFLVEIPAAIRGVPAPRLPGLSWQQGRAAAMTAAVLAMLALGTAGAAPANADTTPAGSSSPVVAAQLASTSADADASATGGVGGHIVTVRSGDTLWDIAQDQLGDGDRYPELVDASAGITQPDGGQLTSAEEIRPGWLVMIPSTGDQAAPGPSLDQQSTPAQQAAPDRQATPHQASSPIASAVDDLDDQMGSSTGGSRPRAESSPSQVQPSQSQGATARSSADVRADRVAVDDQLGPSAASGLGLLAGAGVLAFVEARRRRQRRTRRPGWRLVLPSDAATRAERWLTRSADRPGQADLDAALVDLAARCTPGALPSLRAARLAEMQIEVYVVEEDLLLPAPWVAAGPGTWVLDRLQIARTPSPRSTPWPALVTVGEDEDGARIFLNLDEIGALELSGERHESEAVLTALAVDLVTADDLARAITLVGPLADLAVAVADPRCVHVADIEPVLARLEDPSRGVREGAEVLLVGSTLEPAQAARLRAAVAAAPGTLSIVSTAVGVADWSLSVEAQHEGLSALLAPVGMALRPAALTGAGYDDLLDLLRSTAAPAERGPAWTAPTADPLTIATVPRRDVHAAARGEADEATTSIAQLRTASTSHVRVLGRLQVWGVGTAPRDEDLAAEAAALLALHPGSDAHGAAGALGVTLEDLGWTMQGLDRWLAVPGSPGVSREGDRFSLTGALLDWQQLRTLVGATAGTADSSRLRAALTLVGGAPLDGAPEGRFGWARADISEISAAVADLAHELAQRCLRSGDPSGAEWAARKGLLVEPLSEALWRDVVHAAWQSEQTERAEQALTEARGAWQDPDGLQDEAAHIAAGQRSAVPPLRPAEAPSG